MDTLTQNTPPAGPDKNDSRLEWVAPSHHNHERSARWYAIFGIVILGISAYAVLSADWILAFVTVLLGGVYYLVRREPTPLKYIRIESDGFQFQNTFTPWNQCKEFWLVQTPLFNELHIRKHKGSPQEVSVHTGDIPVTEIRAVLSEYLTMREDQQETLLESIIRICKL